MGSYSACIHAAAEGVNIGDIEMRWACPRGSDGFKTFFETRTFAKSQLSRHETIQAIYD